MSRHWLLAATVAVFVAVLALSERPWSVTDTPGFDRIAVLPPAAQKPVRRWLDDNGIRMPWPALPEAEQPLLAMGYAYREVGALRLPFVAYGAPGLVLFDVRGKWGPPVALDDKGQAVVRIEAGRALDEDYRFAWWRHVWGWLLLLPLALWYWLQLRAERRQADAAGIM